MGAGQSLEDDIGLVKKHYYEPTLVNIHSASNYDIAVLWRRFVKNQKEHKMTRTEFQYMYMVMARAYNETDIGKKNPMPIEAVEQGSIEVWNDLTQEGFDPATNKTSHRDYVDLATFFSLYCNAHHAVRYHELLAVLERMEGRTCQRLCQ